MKQHYVSAVLTLIRSGSDGATVLRGLKRALQARGHERLYRSVLKAALRELTAARATTTVVLANEKDITQAQATITVALAALQAPAGTTPAVRVDTTLIGGVIVEHEARRLDQSYKQRLLKVYCSLTT